MGTYQASIQTPFAHLGIRLLQDRLAAIDFIDADSEIRPDSESAAAICTQIRHYLDNPQQAYRFNIPYLLEGTPFQQKVWGELVKIPAGKTVSYGTLARKLGTSARAVGNACRSNPLPVVIPCHRVVSSNGIGGYSGATSGDLHAIKRWLLEHEGVMLHQAV
ncbi:MAG: methylated-DNA--[protein]-cysteine S-methyltransferase [Gammaproteobacteria bacterium]|jgi:methylated-DNA-[protein]-cysteine S-methyltransferase